MTAVASPPSLQSLPRNGWSEGADTMSSDDLSRMLVPRKSAQRTSSASSLSSTSSATSTASTTSTATTTAATTTNGDWARKKPARGLWPSSKAEPVAGLSTARPGPTTASNNSGTSAAAAISSLQNPAPLPAQILTSQREKEVAAILHLIPINGTFEPKTITVPFTPDLLRVGRQTNQKTLPSPANGYFDSKVLSRQHAEIWAERDGKIWIRDVKSSNGTFVNSKRLSPENRESEPHPLKEQDLLELGIDIVSEDQKTVVHHKVAARVEHAGFHPGGGFMAESLEAQSMSQPLTKGRSNQSSNTSTTRFSGSGNVVANGLPGASAYHAKWLQPVTMEQIVKSLNTELRQARMHAQDLQHAGNAVDVMLAYQEKPKSQNSFASKAEQLKARLVAQPPAPPPSQPLPEAPLDGILNQPVLKRTDTEKPGRGEPSSSLTTVNLVEALTNAQKEIEDQSNRLKEMEELLQKERDERRKAEERASRPLDDGRQPLQEKLDLMRAEMDEMKLQMERYRKRALTAEEASERDRKSLAEMVESIQKREEAVKRKREKRRIAVAQREEPEPATEEQVEEDNDEDDDLLRDVATSVGAQHLANGSAIAGMSSEELHQLVSAAMSSHKDGTLQRSRRQEQLVQSAPYASILGVVLLGVGMMAYLNGWQKVAD